MYGTAHRGQHGLISSLPCSLSAVRRWGWCGACDMEDVIQDKRFADFRGLKRSIYQLTVDSLRKCNGWKRGVRNEPEDPFGINKFSYVLPPAQTREKDPLQAAIDKDWVEVVFRYLTPMMRLVIYGVFFENKSNVEIGREVHLDDSRISQLKTEALGRIKKHLGKELVT